MKLQENKFLKIANDLNGYTLLYLYRTQYITFILSSFYCPYKSFIKRHLLLEKNTYIFKYLYIDIFQRKHEWFIRILRMFLLIEKIIKKKLNEIQQVLYFIIKIVFTFLLRLKLPYTHHGIYKFNSIHLMHEKQTWSHGSIIPGQNLSPRLFIFFIVG